MGDIVDNLRSLARFEHADLSVGDEAADEIKHLRAARDTAFLEGVKAGLEAAKEALLAQRDRAHALAIQPVGVTCTTRLTMKNRAKELERGVRVISAIDPATITRKGGADG